MFVVEFTEHALEEMRIHAVSEDEVRQAIERGTTCRAHGKRSCRRLDQRRTSVTVIFEGRARSGALVITVWRSRR